MPAVALIPLIVGAASTAASTGATIYAAKKGAKAARTAGQMQADAAAQASALQQKALEDSMGGGMDAFKRASKSLEAYSGLNDFALERLKSMRQIGPFQAPNIASLKDDPTYQARLEQGQMALEHSAAARGNLLSGNTFQALQEYGQTFASNEYDKIFNRALQGYNADLAGNQQSFAEMFDVAKLGLDESQFEAGLGRDYTDMFGRWRMGTAAQQGDYLTGGAAARGAGEVGAANVWTGAASNIGNYLSDFGGGFMSLYSPRRPAPIPNLTMPSSPGIAPPTGGGFAQYAPPPRVPSYYGDPRVPSGGWG